jgi:hypothetical protein
VGPGWKRSKKWEFPRVISMKRTQTDVGGLPLLYSKWFSMIWHMTFDYSGGIYILLINLFIYSFI